MKKALSEESKEAMHLGNNSFNELPHKEVNKKSLGEILMSHLNDSIINGYLTKQAEILRRISKGLNFQQCSLNNYYTPPYIDIFCN